MSVLYISEYNSLPFLDAHPAAIAQEPPTVEQVFTVSGTSATSSAFGGNTKVVRIHTDGIVSLQFGAAPTATTSMKRLAANQTEYFYVTPGHKVAAITNT
jgi:hypothetical protein